MMFDMFSSVCWPFVCLVWRTVCWSHLSIFKLGLFVFMLLVKFLGYKFIRYIMFRCFITFSGLYFHFLNCNYWCTKVFNFEEIQFIFFLFYRLWFSFRSKKPALNPDCKGLSPCFTGTFLHSWYLWRVGSRTLSTPKSAYAQVSYNKNGIVFACNLSTSSCML